MRVRYLRIGMAAARKLSGDLAGRFAAFPVYLHPLPHALGSKGATAKGVVATTATKLNPRHAHALESPFPFPFAKDLYSCYAYTALHKEKGSIFSSSSLCLAPLYYTIPQQLQILRL